MEYTDFYSNQARELCSWAYAELRDGNRILASKIFKIAQKVERERRKQGIPRFTCPLPVFPSPPVPPRRKPHNMKIIYMNCDPQEVTEGIVKAEMLGNLLNPEEIFLRCTRPEGDYFDIYELKDLVCIEA